MEMLHTPLVKAYFLNSMLYRVIYIYLLMVEVGQGRIDSILVQIITANDCIECETKFGDTILLP